MACEKIKLFSDALDNNCVTSTSDMYIRPMGKRNDGNTGMFADVVRVCSPHERQMQIPGEECAESTPAFLNSVVKKHRRNLFMKGLFPRIVDQ